MTTRTAEPRTAAGRDLLRIFRNHFEDSEGLDFTAADEALRKAAIAIEVEAAAPAGLDVAALMRAIQETDSEFGRDHSLWEQDAAWRAFAERVAAHLQGKQP